jgi:GNAT superfamily N-acetyltransferase
MTQSKLANFRKANSHDIPAMSKIRLAVSENTLSDPSRITQQMYEDYLELLGRGWVAEIDGTVAGFCYANKTNASIWALFISPEYEGRGLAKQLLNMAVQWLFEQGYEFVRLSTGVGTRADSFYASQGWTQERVDGNEVFYLLGSSRVIAQAAA